MPSHVFSLKPIYSPTIHIHTRPFSLRDCYCISKSCRSRAASGFAPINVRNREGQGKDRNRSEGGNDVPSMRERGSVINIVWRDFFFFTAVCSKMRLNNATLSRYHAGWKIPRSVRTDISKGEMGFTTTRVVETNESAVFAIFLGLRTPSSDTPAGVHWSGGEVRKGEAKEEESDRVARRYLGICAGQSWNAHRVEFIIGLVLSFKFHFPSCYILPRLCIIIVHIT